MRGFKQVDGVWRYTLPSPTFLGLVYGGGGIGKSTLFAEAIAWVYKTYGLKGRIVGADGGGIEAYQGLIDKGIASYWPVDAWVGSSIFALLDAATKGDWPQDPEQPDSPLEPGLVMSRLCPGCGKDCGASGPFTQPKDCKSCKKPIVGRTKLVVEKSASLSEVGIYCFEGATAFGVEMLNQLRKSDPSGGRLIQVGDYQLAGLGKQHYGDAQTQSGVFVGASRHLPIPFVLWSALEQRGQDDDGKPAYGPKFPGKALLEASIPWFNAVVHVDRGDDGKRWLFLEDHPADVKPFMFKAKLSAVLGGGMPSKLEFDPKQNTMGRFFNLLEEARVKGTEALLSKS